jgi:hypothetical protein
VREDGGFSDSEDNTDFTAPRRSSRSRVNKLVLFSFLVSNCKQICFVISNDNTI